MRRTKIVVTIGPATSALDKMLVLIDAGMDVARINLSHATRADHIEMIETIRTASDSLGKEVAILIDLPGPKIRVGELPGSTITLNSNEIVTLTGQPETVGDKKIPISYPGLASDLKMGDRILLSDGLIELKTLKIDPPEIRCKVVNGGVLESKKGVNLPDTTLRLPALTEEDRSGMAFAADMEADWIALSFVRGVEEVVSARKTLIKMNSDIPLIAKIEKHEAIDRIEEIVEASDGIMVARGDLGVEMPPENVPLMQKKIISLSRKVGKPVITATQMLESMVNNPRPTRAEANDVANAILDGTDAVMLSAETTIGKFPVESVLTMAKIAEATEPSLDYCLEHEDNLEHLDPTTAISYAACELALDLDAKVIISSTQSGKTAREVCKHRPKQPVIAVSTNERVVRQLLLSWGVFPLLRERGMNIDEMIEKTISASKSAGFITKGDRVVITAGVMADVPGTTNLIKVHEVT